MFWCWMGHLSQLPRIQDHFPLPFGYERADDNLPAGRLHAIHRFLRPCLLGVEGPGQPERHAPEHYDQNNADPSGDPTGPKARAQLRRACNEELSHGFRTMS